MDDSQSTTIVVITIIDTEDPNPDTDTISDKITQVKIYIYLRTFYTEPSIPVYGGLLRTILLVTHNIIKSQTSETKMSD